MNVNFSSYLIKGPRVLKMIVYRFMKILCHMITLCFATLDESLTKILCYVKLTSGGNSISIYGMSQF